MLSTINKVNHKKKVEMKKKITVILIAFMLVLTACSPTAGEAGPAGTVSQKAIDAAVEAALAAREAEVGGTLVIYSGRKESLVADLIAEFAATSGVEVEVRYAKSAALAGTLELEGAISPADVFFSQDRLSSK